MIYDNETPYDRIERMQKAINNIAPWLSASLSDPNINCGPDYTQACNDIFNLDSSFKIEGS